MINIAKLKGRMGNKKQKIKKTLEDKKSKVEKEKNIQISTTAPSSDPSSEPSSDPSSEPSSAPSSAPVSNVTNTTSTSQGSSWASIAAKPPSPEINKKISPKLKSTVKTVTTQQSVANNLISSLVTSTVDNTVQKTVDNQKKTVSPPKPPSPPPKPQVYDVRGPKWLRINGVDYKDLSKVPKRVRDPSAVAVDIKEIQKKETHININKKGLFEITPLAKCVYTTLFENDEKNRDIKIFRLDDCVSCGYFDNYPNIVFKKQNQSYYPLQDKNVRSTFVNNYENDHMMLKFKQKKQLKRKVNESVFYFIYNTQNVFCFLYDALPYLISYFDLKAKFPMLKLLMQYCDEEKKTFQPFVWPILELLGIQKGDVKMIDGETRYRKIFISSSYTHDEGYHDIPRKEVYELYKKIADAAAEKIKKDIPALPKKIYSSTHTNMQDKFDKMTKQPENYVRRFFTNERDFIENHIVKHKFKEVFTDYGEFSVLEKIVMFSRADAVIGQLGEDIAYSLFSPKTTQLTIIVTPVYLLTFPRFRYCYNQANTKYFTKTEQIEETDFKLYMKIQSKTDFDNIIATVISTNNTTDRIQIEYKKPTGETVKENVDSDNYIKKDEGVDSPWKINLDALKTIKFSG